MMDDYSRTPVVEASEVEAKLVGPVSSEVYGRSAVTKPGWLDPVESKEDQSVKEYGQQQFRTMVSFKQTKDGRERCDELTETITFGDQLWFPFTQYVIDRGWLIHAARLRAERSEPIFAPFGKRVPWLEAVAQMSRWQKQVTDPDLAVWEKRELDDYGAVDFSRNLYLPSMYGGRLLSYDRGMYPGLEHTLPNGAMDFIPTFNPLKSLSEIEVPADARKANTGFPWLTQLSKTGEDYRLSSIFAKVKEAGTEWMVEVLALPRLTTQSVLAVSPPIAVFERAQSGGRPVHDVSKKTNFQQARFTQPLLDRCEQSVAGYAHGSRAELLNQCRTLVDGTGHFALAKGDDLNIRLTDGTIVGVDASSFDAAASAEENIMFIETVAEQCPTEEEAKLWRATCYAENADMATAVGMLRKEPFWGVVSGAERTSILGTSISLARARSAKRDGSVDQLIRSLARRAPYTTREIATESVVFLRLYWSTRNPDRIHGSIVRAVGGACQRESPVLKKRLEMSFSQLEEARLIGLAANLYGHPLFEEFCQWVSKRWQFRTPKAKLLSLGEKVMEKGPDVGRRDRASGSYEREGLAHAADLLRVTA